MTQTLPIKPAICYSGFREHQSPDLQIYPSYEEVKEDLLIINQSWSYIRLYDCDPHAQTVLEVIQSENLPLQVMLGAYVSAEINNENCPWGGTYDHSQLIKNAKFNDERIDRLINWAKRYPSIVHSLSVGNEATVEWTDHLISVERIIEFVRRVKAHCSQSVTFCENYVPWLDKLKPLAAEVDFISIHTYPVWEYQQIEDAIDYTEQNYNAVAELYPEKQVVITEAGWTTNSNGRGIEPSNVCESRQRQYYNELVDWAQKNQIIVFVFEAFDEPWKGSQDPLEPEKHWGLFTVDRKPKLVMQKA
jgi:exo-beta-1,3-glucanase (GH17 family)